MLFSSSMTKTKNNNKKENNASTSKGAGLNLLHAGDGKQVRVCVVHEIGVPRPILQTRK